MPGVRPMEAVRGRTVPGGQGGWGKDRKENRREGGWGKAERHREDKKMVT